MIAATKPIRIRACLAAAVGVITVLIHAESSTGHVRARRMLRRDKNQNQMNVEIPAPNLDDNVSSPETSKRIRKKSTIFSPTGNVKTPTLMVKTRKRKRRNPVLVDETGQPLMRKPVGRPRGGGKKGLTTHDIAVGRKGPPKWKLALGQPKYDHLLQGDDSSSGGRSSSNNNSDETPVLSTPVLPAPMDNNHSKKVSVNKDEAKTEKIVDLVLVVEGMRIPVRGKPKPNLGGAAEVSYSGEESSVKETSNHNVPQQLHSNLNEQPELISQNDSQDRISDSDAHGSQENPRQNQCPDCLQQLALAKRIVVADKEICMVWEISYHLIAYRLGNLEPLMKKISDQVILAKINLAAQFADDKSVDYNFCVAKEFAQSYVTDAASGGDGFFYTDRTRSQKATSWQQWHGPGGRLDKFSKFAQQVRAVLGGSEGFGGHDQENFDNQMGRENDSQINDDVNNIDGTDLTFKLEDVLASMQRLLQVSQQLEETSLTEMCNREQLVLPQILSNPCGILPQETGQAGAEGVAFTYDGLMQGGEIIWSVDGMNHNLPLLEFWKEELKSLVAKQNTELMDILHLTRVFALQGKTLMDKRRRLAEAAQNAIRKRLDALAGLGEVTEEVHSRGEQRQLRQDAEDDEVQDPEQGNPEQDVISETGNENLGEESKSSGSEAGGEEVGESQVGKNESSEPEADVPESQDSEWHGDSRTKCAKTTRKPKLQKATRPANAITEIRKQNAITEIRKAESLSQPDSGNHDDGDNGTRRSDARHHHQHQAPVNLDFAVEAQRLDSQRGGQIENAVSGSRGEITEFTVPILRSNSTPILHLQEAFQIVKRILGRSSHQESSNFEERPIKVGSNNNPNRIEQAANKADQPANKETERPANKAVKDVKGKKQITNLVNTLIERPEEIKLITGEQQRKEMKECTFRSVSEQKNEWEQEKEQVRRATAEQKREDSRKRRAIAFHAKDPVREEAATELWRVWVEWVVGELTDGLGNLEIPEKPWKGRLSGVWTSLLEDFQLPGKCDLEAEGCSQGAVSVELGSLNSIKRSGSSSPGTDLKVNGGTESEISGSEISDQVEVPPSLWSHPGPDPYFLLAQVVCFGFRKHVMDAVRNSEDHPLRRVLRDLQECTWRELDESNNAVESCQVKEVGLKKDGCNNEAGVDNEQENQSEPTTGPEKRRSSPLRNANANKGAKKTQKSGTLTYSRVHKTDSLRKPTTFEEHCAFGALVDFISIHDLGVRRLAGFISRNNWKARKQLQFDDEEFNLGAGFEVSYHGRDKHNGKADGKKNRKIILGEEDFENPENYHEGRAVPPEMQTAMLLQYFERRIAARRRPFSTD